MRLVLLVACLALACGRPTTAGNPSEASCEPWRSSPKAQAGRQLIQQQHSGEVWALLGLGDGMVASEAMAKSQAADGRAGAVVFAASKGRQQSFEANALPGRHGLFTAALLAGLSSADRDGDGAVQLGELVDDVTLRVSQSSEGRHTPWLARRELFGDFRVAIPR